MKINLLRVRDCYSSVRSIRQLMLNLIDNLGDLSCQEASTGEKFFEQTSEQISDMEYALHQIQLKLEKMSEGK